MLAAQILLLCVSPNENCPYSYLNSTDDDQPAIPSSQRTKKFFILRPHLIVFLRQTPEEVGLARRRNFRFNPAADQRLSRQPVMP